MLAGVPGPSDQSFPPMPCNRIITAAVSIYSTLNTVEILESVNGRYLVGESMKNCLSLFITEFPVCCGDLTAGITLSLVASNSLLKYNGSPGLGCGITMPAHIGSMMDGRCRSAKAIGGKRI